MESKRFSVKWLYSMNVILFLSYALSIYFMESKLKLWYILLLIVCLSGFETVFFYNKAEKSFKPRSQNEMIEIVLKSIGLTVVLIGSIIFALILMKGNL